MQSLTDRAYEHIEEMIVTLRLPPGTAISEMALSQRLGMSGTPVVEALQQLAREGLVMMKPWPPLLATGFWITWEDSQRQRLAWIFRLCPYAWLHIPPGSGTRDYKPRAPWSSSPAIPEGGRTAHELLEGGP